MEPFIHLVELTPESALVAWGAFWFTREHPDAQWRIVDDQQLREVAGRRRPIGQDAEPYGEATVEVLDRSGAVVAQATTSDRTWVHVHGLRPDTEHRYRVVVDGQEWAAGERWDWAPAERAGYDLRPAGRSYDLRFRTLPTGDEDVPLRFVVLGDYGVGIISDSESSRRQRRVAEAVERMVVDHGARLVVTTGDNVYQGGRGRPDAESGSEDDGWYSSFYQPYRYVLSRVPVYPSVGNHDAGDSEDSDDRQQVCDNFHTASRFPGSGDRSSVDPGLFYRVGWGSQIELVAVDSSLGSSLDEHRWFQSAKHLDWLRRTFSRPGPRWRIPFSHHPAYCAGPHHGNDEEVLETLLPLYREAGVRLVLAGHEHNFQLSEADGMAHVVTGAGGNLREDLPDGFAEAHTRLFSVQAHALLVDVDGGEARLTPVSGIDPEGRLQRMTALTPEGDVVPPPFVVLQPGEWGGGRTHARAGGRPLGPV
jgi:tartrate-resistant acid phosphatase type 5